MSPNCLQSLIKESTFFFFWKKRDLNFSKVSDFNYHFRHAFWQKLLSWNMIQAICKFWCTKKNFWVLLFVGDIYIFFFLYLRVIEHLSNTINNKKWSCLTILFLKTIHIYTRNRCLRCIQPASNLDAEVCTALKSGLLWSPIDAYNMGYI